MWGWNSVETLIQDVRYCLRQLRRSPGFTAVAVLTLALGIGANTAIFSAAEAALLRSWPAKAPERLVKIIARTPQGRDDTFSYPDYRDLTEQNRLIAGILAYSRRAKILRVGAETRLVRDDLISPNYFTVLGIQAQYGRTFSAGPQPSSELSVVVSDLLWRRDFNADLSLVGKQIWLTGRSYTVIGIAPPHFRGLERGAPTDVWLPVATDYDQELRDRNYRDFELLGRLRPGETAERARVELGTIGRRLADTYPAIDKMRDVSLVSEGERLREALLPTFLLMTAVGLVLLICCANVAGLLVARSETRRREIALRLALGATRLRLIRQLLSEGALLALAGGALGLLLAYWLISLEPALIPPSGLQSGPDLRLDVWVIAFTAAAAVVAVIAFGLAPALLLASKSGLVAEIKGEEPIGGPLMRRFRARNAMVLVEIATSMVLLTASGLFARSLLCSRGINLGFDKQKNVLFFDLAPGIAGYDAGRSLSYLEQVQDRVAGLPGVSNASFARRVLLSDSGGGAELRVSIPGVELPQGQANIPIKFNAVSPRYFRTMGTRILAGNDFTPANDTAAPRVVVISQTMARRFWPGKEAIGQRIMVEDKDYQIVGVAEDAKINQIHEAPEPYMYLPFAQVPSDWGTLIVETAGDSRAWLTTIRSGIQSVDPKVPIEVRTLHYLMQQALWQDQMTAGFAGTLGMLGMFLAAVGLHGVIAYMVNRRRHEIGIRMALGAQRQDVLRLVLGQGLRLAAIGTGVGLMASLAAMRLLSSLLYGVRPTDPLALAGSLALVMLVAVTASYIPARRATRVDPIVALRHE